MRAILFSIAGLLALSAIAPVSLAATPGITVTIASPDHPDPSHIIVLPYDGQGHGKGIVNIDASAVASGFVCVQATTLTIEIHNEDPPYPSAWAAGPMEPAPPTVEFVIPANEATMFQDHKDIANTKTPKPYMDMAWNTDPKLRAPNQKLEWRYHVTGKVTGWDEAACPQAPNDAQIKIVGVDIPVRMDEVANLTKTDCSLEDNKVLPECSANVPVTTQAPNTPGFDVVALMVASVGGLALLRRSKK